MVGGTPTAAQQAVTLVVAGMAGRPADEVAEALDDWLERRGATLPPPAYAATVDAIASGRQMVLLSRLGADGFGTDAGLRTAV